ncbi:MAG: hypothetical protein GWO85_01150 [Simkaniaceae bacterium]|nr:hypothetical protein [Simkaniaceae bacterium]
MKSLARIVSVVLMVLTITFAAKPNISIITSAITPRIHLWSAEENTHWLTLINYKQEMGSIFQLNSSFEVGSVDEYLRNPLRVYLFSAKLKLKNNNLSFGRLSYWSGLVSLRFDGFKVDYKNKFFGNITVASGFDAVYDFSDTTWMDYPVVLLSWSKGSRNKKIGLTYWQEYFGKDVHTFTGVQWTQELFGFRYSQQFAYDLTGNRIQSYRTHIAKNFGKHYTSLGVRQRRFMVKEVFPWVDESVQMPSTLYISVKSIYSKTLMVWSQFSFRLGDNGTTYAHSTILFRDASLTALYGGYNGSTLLGGQIGYRKTLTSSLKCGIKLEFNALDMADNIIEPVKSKGSYGWIGWSPKESVSIRLFYRYASNKYYTVDGRGGMTIHVAL